MRSFLDQQKPFFLNGQDSVPLKLMLSWLLVYLIGITEPRGIAVSLCVRQQGVEPRESVVFRRWRRRPREGNEDMESLAYSPLFSFSLTGVNTSQGSGPNMGKTIPNTDRKYDQF